MTERPGRTITRPITPRMQADALTEAIRKNPPKLRFTQGMADHAAAMEQDIPPFPSVTLGAGRWLHVIGVLRRSGTKASAQLADQIEKQIHE